MRCAPGVSQADKTAAGLTVCLLEAMVDGNYAVTRVIAQKVLREDICALANAQAPYMTMTTGLHAPFDALMPQQYERMTRSILRSLGQLRFTHPCEVVTHHCEVVVENNAARAARPVVQAMGPMTADDLAKCTETGLALLWSTAQEI